MHVKFCNKTTGNIKVYTHFAVIHGTKGQFKDSTKMGMAASQARLLALTSRMHDVENRAQKIQNAKLALSTQEDAVYEEYLKALDAATLTLTAMDNGTRSTIVANFNNMFSMDHVRPANGKDFILVDSRGRVVVEDEIAEEYENYLNGSGLSNRPHDAYGFAMYMMTGGKYPHTSQMNGNCGDPLMDRIVDVFYNLSNGGEDNDETLVGFIDKLKELIVPTPTGHNRLSKFIKNPNSSQVTNAAEYEATMHQMYNYLFTTYGNSKIFHDSIDENYDIADFNYYVKIFSAIEAHDGQYIRISDYNGLNETAANSSDWLTAMIESGQMTIESLVMNNDGSVTISGSSVSSDSSLNFTPTSDIDKTAVAQAEAKYEHEMKKINRKDTQYDVELKKLETERKALDTEKEGIKKVIEDNVQRTFKIFS